jgi:uncharacterized membrane protein YfcA
MDENQLRGMGYDRFMKKHFWLFFGGIILAFAALLLIAKYLPNYQFIGFVPSLLFVVVWYYFVSKESKKVLDFVKGKEEPVDLDELDG